MKSIIALILTFYTLSLPAQIIETHHFKDVESHVDIDTLLLLDIDDTLLIPAQMLGCDEWFKHRLEVHINNGLPFSKALDATIAQWEAIRHLTEMQIVEPGTELIVNKMQDSGFKVMGLTTQGIGLSHRTIEHLLEHKIILDRSAPFKDPFYMEYEDHGILFRKGVLFTNGRNKGIALFSLLDHYNFKPKKIVFINDKDTHLKEIEIEAEKHGIEFVGLRYAYSDHKKACFDPDLAEIQFHNSSFGGILSDNDALNKKIEELLIIEGQE
ncbi:MAG: DUF2608 domain-containing protein [Chlamydiae bacterium]|nr:DUF2608 domain-containing protein [Chlamydiota bacterium]